MHDLAAGGVGAIALPIELLSVRSERSLCTLRLLSPSQESFLNHREQGGVEASESGALYLPCQGEQSSADAQR